MKGEINYSDFVTKVELEAKMFDSATLIQKSFAEMQERMDNGFALMLQRFDKMDAKFDAKFDFLHSEINRVENKLDNFQDQTVKGLDNLGRSITRITDFLGITPKEEL